MNTATELSRPGLSPTVPMPRMRAEPLASDPVDETSSDGAKLVQLADIGRAAEFFISSPPTAVTAIGTSCSTWRRPCAVMMISFWPVCAAAWACGVTPACSVGEGVVALVLVSLFCAKRRWELRRALPTAAKRTCGS